MSLNRFFNLLPIQDLRPTRIEMGWLPGSLIRWIQSQIQRYLNLYQVPRPVSRQLFQRLDALYGSIEKTAAWKLVQFFGVCFHFSSIMTALALGVFSDLTFAWSTTLPIQARDVYQILSWIGWPFSWLSADLVPSMEVVARTQFDRFENRYLSGDSGRGLDTTLDSTVWWQYLVCCMIFYSFLPRLVFWLWSHWSLKQQLSQLSFRDHASQSLWHRLHDPLVEWQHQPQSDPKGSPINQGQHFEKLKPRLQGDHKNCIVIKWFDAPFPDEAIRRFLGDQFQWQVLDSISMTGTTKDTEKLMDQLRSVDLTKPPVLVIVAEPWELPGEALEKLIRKIHDSVGVPLSILFAPFVHERDQLSLPKIDGLKLWRYAIQSFRNPYIGLLTDYGVDS